MKPELNDSTSNSGSGETPETDAFMLIRLKANTTRETYDLVCALVMGWKERAEALVPPERPQQETQHSVENAQKCIAGEPHEPHGHCDGGPTLVPRPTEGEASEEARDAKRYRWLRDSAHPNSESGLFVGSMFVAVGEWRTRHHSGEKLDAAIDAAMTGEKACPTR